MAMRRLANGLWAIEPRRREFFGLVHQFLPLAASTIGGRDNIQIDGQADYWAWGTNAVYTDGQGKIQFIVQPDHNLFETPVFLGALGRGNFPRWYQVPILIPRAQTFSAIADDRQAVAADNNIRILHIGQKVYDRPFEAARAYHGVEEYDFVANFTSNDGGVGPIAANGTNIEATNVFADSDFDIYKLSILADGDATIQVETSGKSLQWFNRPAHIGLLGASTLNAAIPAGAWPFRLPGPLRVPASGSIVTTVADLSGFANRIQVVYHGVRLKPPGGLPIDPRQLLAAGAPEVGG